MDRDRFDALTRLMGRAGSRRAAVGAVLGATVGGSAFVAQAKKGGGKKGKKGKKKKGPQTCFGTRLCEFPSDGQDFENCDLSGAFLLDCNGCNFRNADLGGANLSITSYQGVSFREANLGGANLQDADVSGASFRDACLAGANFFDANTDGADFRGAIFCGTRLPDGSIDDSGCDDTNNCCQPACAKDVDCPSDTPTCCNGLCVDTQSDPLNCGGCLEACFTNETCIGGECVAECGESCIKDKDCPDGQTCCDGVCCGGFFSCVPHIPGPGDVCVDTGIGGCTEPCVKDVDCPTGWACIDDDSCGETHCHPLCNGGGGGGGGFRASGRRRGH